VKESTEQTPPSEIGLARVVHTVALLAALLALSVCLWQGSGWIVAIKRTVISYLSFFFIGGILALVVRLWGLPEQAETPPSAGASRSGLPAAEEAPPAESAAEDAGTERAKSMTP
jgi:hypothetical protein